MKALKKILSIVIAIVLLLSPLGVSLGALFALPDPFEYSFTSALDEKYDRLNSIDSPKIIVLGGSSVPFGVRSDIIEEYTDMPVVNFGLYAALGTKLMLDLSRPAIGEGDVVILTPEISAQTLSLYFNTETTLRAIGKRWDMLLPLPVDNKLSLISGSWNYAAEKMSYYKLSLSDKGAGFVDPEGVYNSRNFNEYGDLVWERTENKMLLYHDPNNMITPSPEIVEDEFIDYVNSYVSYCKMRGATVYFNFCPMNEMGFADGFGIAELNAFADYLEGVLDCELLGSPERSVLGAGYFYDTNFHLGESGAVKYTKELTEDILFALDIPRSVRVEVPDEPPLPSFDSYIDLFDENEKYFTFAELAGGYYTVTGLTELGKSEDVLTLPVAYNNRRVTSLSGGALDGISATKLIITENTNIRLLSVGCFEGAETLRELWIYFPEDDNLLPPKSFNGVSESFTVHVPQNSGYATGYEWGESTLYGNKLTFIHDAN